MTQFDVHRLGDGILVVDLQSDLIGLDRSRVVAPMRSDRADIALPRLTPRIEIDGRSYSIWMQEMAMVPASALGPVVGTALPWQDEIKEAIDVLFRGF